MVSRLVDYLDSLLADSYTRHVSVQVMSRQPNWICSPTKIRCSMTASSGRVCRQPTGWP